LTFRFAAAAHPTDVTLDTSFGKYEVSLTNLPRTIPNQSVLSVGSFADLSAQLSRSTDKMELTFSGQCRTGENTYKERGYGMDYRVRNLDRFNAIGTGVKFTYMVYYGQGTYEHYTREMGRNLGPGMESTDVWTWADFLDRNDADPLYLITYNATGDAFIYPGHCREKL
jgi:hypothetical protein